MQRGCILKRLDLMYMLDVDAKECNNHTRERPRFEVLDLLVYEAATRTLFFLHAGM